MEAEDNRFLIRDYGTACLPALKVLPHLRVKAFPKAFETAEHQSDPIRPNSIVAAAAELHPDLILLDIGLPSLNGIAAARPSGSTLRGQR